MEIGSEKMSLASSFLTDWKDFIILSTAKPHLHLGLLLNKDLRAVMTKSILLLLPC